MSSGGTLSPQALGAIEPPGAWESMGRGVADAYEPLVQAWYNASDKERAAAYRAARAENERLYQRGFLAGNPPSSKDASSSNWLTPKWGSNPYPPGALPSPPKDAQTTAPPDTWRQLGYYGLLGATMAPFVPTAAVALTPEAVGGMALTGSAYQSLDALRRKLGILE
jgi:hypothetical protein